MQISFFYTFTKNNYTIKKIFLLLITFLILSCHKDDNKSQTLPPATQTGAGTFACFVNGKPFIDTSGGYFNCFYQFVDGGYEFGIGGRDSVGMLKSITLLTYDKQIFEGETYPLLEPIDGNASGNGVLVFNISTGTTVNTSSIDTGELTITKLDFTTHIVSGTFSFNLKNPYTNEVIEIRDGRFDTFFTQ